LNTKGLPFYPHGMARAPEECRNSCNNVRMNLAIFAR
jgi:hypothetical protein